MTLLIQFEENDETLITLKTELDPEKVLTMLAQTLELAGSDYAAVIPSLFEYCRICVPSSRDSGQCEYFFTVLYFQGVQLWIERHDYGGVWHSLSQYTPEQTLNHIKNGLLKLPEGRRSS